MKILMTETRRGTEDGYVVQCFKRDEEYDVAPFMANQFIRNGWAKPVTIQPRNMREAFEVLSHLPAEG